MILQKLLRIFRENISKIQKKYLEVSKRKLRKSSKNPQNMEKVREEISSKEIPIQKFLENPASHVYIKAYII